MSGRHFARAMSGAVVTCLTACSNGSQLLAGSQLPVSPLAQSASTVRQTAAARSWMAPDAKNGPLLYVTGGGDVDVFQWPSLQTAGVLKGFRQSTGACVDAFGNVWIADTYAQKLFEYAHGGTTPIATLDDAAGFPNGCAINKRNGDLAVANDYNDVHNQGSITIYKHASGQGAIYYDSGVADVLALDYAPNGNIFIEGWTTYTTEVQKFARKKFQTIAIHGATIKYGAGIQYQKGGLTAGAYESGNVAHTTIYRIDEQGKVLGHTVLQQTAQSFQYQILNGKVICPDYGNRELLVYPYPTSGSPTKTRSKLKGVFPWGAAVSPATAPKTSRAFR
jgi:hypothetical protein